MLVNDQQYPNKQLEISPPVITISFNSDLGIYGIARAGIVTFLREQPSKAFSPMLSIPLGITISSKHSQELQKAPSFIIFTLSGIIIFLVLA